MDSNSGVFANGSELADRRPAQPERHPCRSAATRASTTRPRTAASDVAGKLVVTVRGTCARTFRAGAAQHFGAAAAAMIDTSAGSYPPYEGPIPGGAVDPNAGNIYEPVTIPFFGVLATDTTTLTGGPSGANPAAPGARSATTPVSLANPGFEKIASFSSAGPAHRRQRAASRRHRARRVDRFGGVRHRQRFPDPVGHLDGHAARRRRRRARRSRRIRRWPRRRSARGDRPDRSPRPCWSDYLPRNEGAGLAQAQLRSPPRRWCARPTRACRSDTPICSSDFNATKTATVHNAGPKAVQFNIAVTKSVGPAGVTVTAPASVIVDGNGDAQFPVTLTVPASVGTGGTAFQDVGGYVQLTPSEQATERQCRSDGPVLPRGA